MKTEVNINRRIVSLDGLKQDVYRWKFQDKKVVFTNGCFDILHLGHVRYLSEAADLGDILIVGLNSDASVKRLKGDTRPINTQEQRAEILASLFFVEAVIIFDEDTPENLIQEVAPHVLVKGGDYSPDQIAGADFVKSTGGEVAIIPLTEGYSTSSFIDKLKTFY